MLATGQKKKPGQYQKYQTASIAHEKLLAGICFTHTLVLRDKNTNCDADDVICKTIYLGYLYKLDSNMNIIWHRQGFL